MVGLCLIKRYIKMDKEIIKSHFLCLYGMMLADSSIDPLELKTFYELGEKRGLHKEEINEYVLSVNTTRNVPTKLNDKISLLYDLAQIVWADGKIDDAEISLMKKFCQRMNFKDENIDKIVEFILEEVKNGVSEEELLKKIKE